MTITQGFHRALQQRPDATAVCFESRRQTFREFGLRVARLAGALRQLGMRPGDRVAMLALNSDRYLEYQLGVPWGRGVLNPCNVRWSAAEILFALDDSGSTILIFDDAFASMIDTIRSGSKSVRQFIYAGEHDAPAGAHSYEALVSAATPVADESRIDDTVGVFYTGGTTGNAKGVMLQLPRKASHRGTRFTCTRRRCFTSPTMEHRNSTGCVAARIASSRRFSRRRSRSVSSVTASPICFWCRR